MANIYFPIYPEQSTPTQLPGETSATQKYPLGTKLEARDGRIWRYCKAGGTQLSAGLMGQSPAIDAKLESEVQTNLSTNIGDTVISVLITTGSGLVPANLAGGYMVIEDATGEGQYYKIQTAAWSTGDTVLSVTLDEPIRVATDATSKVSLYPNPWLGIVVAPTTLTGYCVGVATGVITANHYYWAQRCGPCAMVVDAGETVKEGEAAGYPASIATPGAVGIPEVTDPIWGHFMGVAAAGETALVYLNME